MKKASIMLSLVLLCVTLPLGAGPWSGGYRVGVAGYNVESFSSDEYVMFSALYEPFGLVGVHPSVQMGFLVPTVSQGSEHTQVVLGVGSGLFVLHQHPFKAMFRRDSAMVPRLESSLYFDINGEGLTAVSAALYPFSFHWGDKYISLLGATVVRDLQHDTWGWGIRLFEISHYLW